MRNQRALAIGGVLLLGAAACSSAPGEPTATAQQAVEGACAHSLCASGAALEASCDPCATTLCAHDPYCCAVEWDATCVGEVASICGQSCTAPAPTQPAPGPSACAHPLCQAGGALAAPCDPCATSVCAQDPYCCAVAWDATCVGEVGSICGQACN